MAEHRYINTVLIFQAETVTAGADSESDAIDLSRYHPLGYFALEVSVTGTGTAKFECLSSVKGTDYIEPSTTADIVTSHTVTSGPGADGKEVYRFYPLPSKFMKIKVTETGGAASIVVTATLLIH